MEKSNINIKKFETLLEEKRHKELITILDKVASLLSDNSSDKHLVDGISNQNDKITALLKQIETIKLDGNNQELSEILNKISYNILENNNKVVDTLENRMLPDTFVLIKDAYGVTQLVKVNYKKAKDIKN